MKRIPLLVLIVISAKSFASGPEEISGINLERCEVLQAVLSRSFDETKKENSIVKVTVHTASGDRTSSGFCTTTSEVITVFFMETNDVRSSISCPKENGFILAGTKWVSDTRNKEKHTYTCVSGCGPQLPNKLHRTLYLGPNRDYLRTLHEGANKCPSFKNAWYYQSQ